MKAWVVRELGPPESLSLEDVPEPQPADGVVLLRVRAAAVNFFDSLQIAGQYQVKPPLPFVPGGEVAGEVISAPPDSGLKAGDRVMAQTTQAMGMGGYVEVTQTIPQFARTMPDGMSFEEGAAFFVNYQTGWFGLTVRARLEAGETLLVHAGAGGVGSAAIQLGKALGARVIATASSAAKLDVCRRMGADEVINYREQDFAEEVKRLTAGAGADVIYDPVGGDVFDRSTKCIAFEGRIVIVGFTSGRIPEARANHLLVKNYATVGLHWGAYVQRGSPLVAEATRRLGELYTEGRIKPYVSRTFPLAEAPTALAEVAGGRTTGKVVLVP